MSELSETPLKDPENKQPPAVSSYYRVKHVFDIAVVIATLPIIGPIILLLMLLIKLTSKGPIFYSQIRCAKDEKPFKMYKLRSMIVNAEANGIVWSPGTKKDPRITPLGRIMRRLHLDELPQIWNVLRGEMDVIGPRPERPEYIKKLKEQVPYYEYRMLIRPGMTGYAQLNWKADTGLEDVHRKVILDLEYIETVTPWFDFRILLGTAFQFLPSRIFGTFPLRLCGIYRPAEQSPWADRIGILDDHLSVHLSGTNKDKK